MTGAKRRWAADQLSSLPSFLRDGVPVTNPIRASETGALTTLVSTCGHQSVSVRQSVSRPAGSSRPNPRERDRPAAISSTIVLCERRTVTVSELCQNHPALRRRHERSPQAFVWTKTADDILDSVARWISNSGH